MSHFQGCPCPPPPPGIWHFFFWSNFPSCEPFLWSNALLPRDFLGVKCPSPWAERTLKPRLISERGFQHYHFYYFFVYQFNVYVHHFFSVYIAITYSSGIKKLEKYPRISGLCCLTNVRWTFIELSVETSLLMNIPTFWLKRTLFGVGLKFRSKLRMYFL